MAVTLQVGITLNSQNVTNNTSNVTVYVNAVSTGGSFNNYSSGSLAPTGTLTLGGNASGSYGFTHTFAANVTTRLYTRTFNVTHNADGTGSVSASASFNTHVSSGTVYGSASRTLPKIARASTPTVSGATQLGSTMTINTNRASSNFTHTLTWSWAGNSGTIATGVGASATWTPSIATFAPYLTTAASSTCTITCVTYQGSTTIGTKTTSFTLSIPSSVVPTLSSSSVTDSAGYLATYGALVQSRSVVVVTATGAGVYGSTITSITATLDGSTATGANGAALSLGSPPTAGARTVTITATDSRGRSITGTRAVTVASWTVPTLDASAFRATGGVEDDESTTVRVTFSGSVANVNGAGINSGTVKISHGAVGSSSVTTDYTASVGQTFSSSYDIAGLANTSSFVIYVDVTDSFGGTATMSFMVGTASPLIDFEADGNGIAFFGISNESLVKLYKSMKVQLDAGADDYGSGARLTMLWQRGDGSYAGGDLIRVGGATSDGYPELFPDLQHGDRARVRAHMALDNNKFLLGRLTSGGDTRLIGMNSSNQVELAWTSGGLRGRVMKQIWSGTVTTGSINVPELPYYNLLAAFASGSYPWGFLGVRQPGGTYMVFYAISAAANAAEMRALTAEISGTTLNFTRNAYENSDSGFTSNGFSINRIYGLL